MVDENDSAVTQTCNMDETALSIVQKLQKVLAHTGTPDSVASCWLSWFCRLCQLHEMQGMIQCMGCQE
jgi:hypothetical protein